MAGSNTKYSGIPWQLYMAENVHIPQMGKGRNNVLFIISSNKES